MKSAITIILMTLALPFAALADFQGYRISPCTYWMPNSNGSGYVCQNMPFSIVVPRADSLDDYLKAQDERIAKLEQKIQELELKCKKD